MALSRVIYRVRFALAAYHLISFHKLGGGFTLYQLMGGAKIVAMSLDRFISV
jgi:hypothetical protein